MVRVEGTYLELEGAKLQARKIEQLGTLKWTPRSMNKIPGVSFGTDMRPCVHVKLCDILEEMRAWVITERSV